MRKVFMLRKSDCDRVSAMQGGIAEDGPVSFRFVSLIHRRG